MKPKPTFAAATILFALTPLAHAQSSGFAWSENAGYLNWSADNGEAQGPVATTDTISGFVWAENLGWINLGDGSPVPPRDLQTGDDFGVGIDTDGFLFGYAWSENAGWVTLGPFLDDMGNERAIIRDLGPVTVDARPRLRSGRLRGYAWAENFGWINLDDDVTFVRLLCPADLNADGSVNFADYTQFLNDYAEGNLRVDLDESGTLNFADVAVFLSDYAAGCP